MNNAQAVWTDLLQPPENAPSSGPQWAHESEELDVTLLSWQAGKRLDQHVNDEVDVLWVGVQGEGTALVDGQAHPLRAGIALLIPRGATRSLECGDGRLSYLSVHRRRRGLMPTLHGQRLQPIELPLNST